MLSYFDLNEEEFSLGLMLKFLLIYLLFIMKGIFFKFYVWSFKKDEEFKKWIKGGEYLFDDICYCWYLWKRGCLRFDIIELMKLY